jgi:hypothetical protein
MVVTLLVELDKMAAQTVERLETQVEPQAATELRHPLLVSLLLALVVEVVVLVERLLMPLEEMVAVVLVEKLPATRQQEPALMEL